MCQKETLEIQSTKGMHTLVNVQLLQKGGALTDAQNAGLFG